MLTQKNGLVQLTVAQMVAQLSQAYSGLVRSDLPLDRFPSVMLWGPPGVGKSQGVRQVADQIRKQTGKRVAVTDVRLLLFNPVDLRGIPHGQRRKDPGGLAEANDLRHGPGPGSGEPMEVSVLYTAGRMFQPAVCPIIFSVRPHPNGRRWTHCLQRTDQKL